MWPMIALSALKAGYDKYHSDLDRKAEAQKELYSPWTNYQGKDVAKANVMGDLMSGGMAGMQMDQASKNADQNGKLSDAMANYYNSKSAAPGAASAGGWPNMSGPSLTGGSLQYGQIDPSLLQFGRSGF